MVSYTADEEMGRVTLVINSTIPNPGHNEIILRINTMDGTAIGMLRWHSIESLNSRRTSRSNGGHLNFLTQDTACAHH